MSNIQTLLHTALPLIIIIGSFVIGYIFEKVIVAKLKYIASKTTWGGDDIIIASLRGMIPLWFLLAGTASALHSFDVQPQTVEIFQKVLLVVAIISITLLLSRIGVGLITVYTKRDDVALPRASIFRNVTKLTIFVLGALILLQTLGISITPILTALGIGGLAVELALQDTLTNLFAGIQILASRQIKTGNYIKLDSGEERYITDITWRNTTIRALPNNLIVVPNAKFASATVVNYYLPETEMSVLVGVSVSYQSNLTDVE